MRKLIFVVGGAVVVFFVLKAFNGFKPTTPVAELTTVAVPYSAPEATVSVVLAPDPKKVKEIFTELDASLRTVENGGNPKGSFTDWFVIKFQDAKDLGATNDELNKRLDRVIALAEKGQYFSSFVYYVFENEGADGLKKYIEEKKYR